MRYIKFYEYDRLCNAHSAGYKHAHISASIDRIAASVTILLHTGAHVVIVCVCVHSKNSRTRTRPWARTWMMTRNPRLLLKLSNIMHCIYVLPTITYKSISYTLLLTYVRNREYIFERYSVELKLIYWQIVDNLLWVFYKKLQ